MSVTSGKPQRILVIIPSLDRNRALSECLQSLISLSTGLADYFAVTRRTGGWIKALNSVPMSLVSQYDIIGIINDDVRMRTASWDRLVCDRLDKKPGLLYGRDGIQDERLATQPFLTADWVVKTGVLAPHCMEHSLVDNMWWEVFSALQAITYEPALFTEHLHVSVGKSPSDSTYQMGADAWSRDWPKWEWFHRNEVPKLVAKIRGKKIISFSLWGDGPKYVDGASINRALADRWYPGWTLRVYCEPKYASKMAAMGYEVVERRIKQSHWEGLFWRFEPVFDTDVFIVRDLDSRLNPRESAAVAAWLQSGKFAHVMRDHPLHDVAMVGGMWGCHCWPAFRDLLNDWKVRDHKGSDQEFLEQRVWPRLNGEILIHDSAHTAEGIQPFPPHEPMDPSIYGPFVGSIVSPL